LAGYPIDPYSFFPDAIVQFRGQDFELGSLISEPQPDYFELGKFMANLPFLFNYGHSPSDGVTKFLESVHWGKGLEAHFNQIKDIEYIDSEECPEIAQIARKILANQKEAHDSDEAKHQVLTDLAMLGTAFQNYFDGYKTFVRVLKNQFDECGDLANEFSDPLNPTWSDLNDMLWENSEHFWEESKAAVQQALSSSKNIGWWISEETNSIFSFGDSWFAVHDKDEDSFSLVPPTTDLLGFLGYYAGEDCVWFKDLKACDIQHNHDEARVLYLDAQAPKV
jgi:hypothetical protein